MFVCEMVGDHVVEAYSRIGLVIDLYVVMSVSFCCPQRVEVRLRSMLMVLLALSQMLAMCLVYVCCVSIVTPRILLWF